MGTDVNETMLFETLQVVGLTEDVRTVIRLRKKNMNLCMRYVYYETIKREPKIKPRYDAYCPQLIFLFFFTYTPRCLRLFFFCCKFMKSASYLVYELACVKCTHLQMREECC